MAMKMTLFALFMFSNLNKTRTAIACAAALLFFPMFLQRAQAASPTELLEKGIYAEETRGDLNSAIQLYQQIVDDPSAGRGIVAQAQLRLGLCELKLGHKPQAISALQHITQEFPDKDRLLALVEGQMPGLLEEIIKQIEQNYFREIDRSELMETAIRAIIGKLDSSTGLRPNDMEFLNTNEVAQLNLGLEQRLAGIGAVLKVDQETGEIVIDSALPGSPALKAGVLPGDRIVSINGKPAPDKIASVVGLLRGPAGSPVALGIKRGDPGDLLDLQLVRDEIRLSSVKGDHYKPDAKWEFMLDDSRKIGYLRLTEVAKLSLSEMRAALDELTTRGMKALILDLRSNPGGLLSEAVAISDLFVENGIILTVKGRSGDQVYEAHPEGTFSGFPMAVLVNRHTASAAEIIAACLQDHQRAVIIGERTFGQGIVRSIVSLKGGSGALKIPVASYFRPSGKAVNRYPDARDSEDWGVQPDDGYEVKVSEAEVKQYLEDQTQRGKLNGTKKPTAPFDDRQLTKALNWAINQLSPK
jgi:carboxyl-terminal processing protease